MTNEFESITLCGKLFITGHVRAVTGLHIGGAGTGLEIGGVDNIVVRNPMDNRPYIPGSSLRGKLRSLLEKRHGLSLNKTIHDEPQVRIHECKDEKTYAECPVCHIFGVAGDRTFGKPALLLVRDVPLSEESAQKLDSVARTDLPFTEIKWEAAIDRITSAALPRQFERVPAGTVFRDFELVYSFYEQADAERLCELFTALELLEDDYLGGMGSRGYGKITLEGITLKLKSSTYYARMTEAQKQTLISNATVADLRSQESTIVQMIKERLWPSALTTG